MTPWRIFRVPCDVQGALSMMPCPPADNPEDAFARIRAQGVGAVLSMLPQDEAALLGMASEEALCAARGMTYLSHPIADFGLPDPGPFDDLIADLVARLKTGQHLAVHCRAGIGRSGMVAAASLVALGAAPDAALARVSEARGVAVPDTVEQGVFVASFAQRLKSVDQSSD